ncbi:AraC family transcriptional regulator [Microbispora sp. NBRC 16548]|uniref:helix-turn-helix domain-containing protein n=1 Tax=Microbispora sp. NBRC 16548 TaxID=3030994 RepID=UPI0024A081DA|nr:AraC family transcriptional regulator [Microbispora sp. NBRC 16548]GLX10396.1 AraC family transcriptional regulator [Microbispora sp. NBRC 16548]
MTNGTAGGGRLEGGRGHGGLVNPGAGALARTETTSRFDVGHGYALYQGPSWDSGFHRHAAFQIVVAVAGEAAMVDASGVCHRAVALVVPPMVRHRMLATTDLRVFFVEPQCAFADRLRERCVSGRCVSGRWGSGISAAPELRELSEDDVRLAGARPSGELDPRLLAAMDALADGPVSMPDLAARVDMSPQRLRGLARSQLGMPLTRWRVWGQLRRTVEALRAGRSLAEAAAVSGFADQAHLTRWMREMMGLTPAVVLPVLRPSLPEGDVDRDRTGDR